MGVPKDIDKKIEPNAELDAKENSKSQIIKEKKSEKKTKKILNSQKDEATKSTPIETMSEYEKIRAKKLNEITRY